MYNVKPYLLLLFIFYEHRWALLCACGVMFAVGLSMTTKGGMYVLQMMDSYSSTFSALMVGMTEVDRVTLLLFKRGVICTSKINNMGRFNRNYKFVSIKHVT